MDVSCWSSWGPRVTFQGFEINGVCPNVLISTSVSRRAQSERNSHPPKHVSNSSWFSSRFLSRTCCSRVKHRGGFQLMDPECSKRAGSWLRSVAGPDYSRDSLDSDCSARVKGKRMNYSLSRLSVDSVDSIVRMEITISPLGPWVVSAALTQLWVRCTQESVKMKNSCTWATVQHQHSALIRSITVHSLIAFLAICFWTFGF